MQTTGMGKKIKRFKIIHFHVENVPHMREHVYTIFSMKNIMFLRETQFFGKKNTLFSSSDDNNASNNLLSSSYREWNWWTRFNALCLCSKMLRRTRYERWKWFIEFHAKYQMKHLMNMRSFTVSRVIIQKKKCFFPFFRFFSFFVIFLQHYSLKWIRIWGAHKPTQIHTHIHIW